MNVKAKAWDAIGADFWHPSYYSGPTQAEVGQFLRGVDAGASLCILGASTISLIRACLERSSDVTVIDFSEGMLTALKSEIGESRCRTIRHDLLDPPPPELSGIFDAVFSDRLINRFDDREMPVACRNMFQLVGKAHLARHKVRLGFYERDIAILEAGRRNGTLANFYFPLTQEIDYSRATTELSELLAASGEVPQDKVRKFHKYRGLEKRPSLDEIVIYHERIRGCRLLATEVSEAVAQDLFFDFTSI